MINRACLTSGFSGILDEGLLDSALEQPKAMFEGSYLHGSLAKMAAAYGFHIYKNHPFIDGNKRVALERKKAQYQLCLMYILKRGGQLALNYISRKLHRYYKRVTFELQKGRLRNEQQL